MRLRMKGNVRLETRHQRADINDKWYLNLSLVSSNLEVLCFYNGIRENHQRLYKSYFKRVDSGYMWPSISENLLGLLCDKNRTMMIDEITGEKNKTCLK